MISLLALLICSYVGYNDGLDVRSSARSRRFFYGMDPSYYASDRCHYIPCGQAGASYDPNIQTCRCGNNALCRFKSDCAHALKGCPNSDIACENYICTCKTPTTTVGTSTRATASTKAPYDCHYIPCGKVGASYDPSIQACRCGNNALCRFKSHCAHALKGCPPSGIACENYMCTCKTSATSNSTVTASIKGTGIPCNQIPCGKSVSVYVPHIDLCACGLVAICQTTDSCKHALYGCPKSHQVCEYNQCKCKSHPNKHHGHGCNNSSDCNSLLIYCPLKMRQCVNNKCQCVSTTTTTFAKVSTSLSKRTMTTTKPTTGTTKPTRTTTSTVIPSRSPIRISTKSNMTTSIRSTLSKTSTSPTLTRSKTTMLRTTKTTSGPRATTTIVTPASSKPPKFVWHTIPINIGGK